MGTSRIEQARIHRLDNGRSPAEGAYVLYWMQSAVRTLHNQALEFAAQKANEHSVPLLVGFAVDPDYPESSLRHARFVLEGVAAVASTLNRRRIGFHVEIGPPAKVAARLAEDSVLVVTDRGHLRHLRQWRRHLVKATDVPVFEIETNLVVPVETVSDKVEYGARTIRPKIRSHLDEYIVELNTTSLDRDGRNLDGPADPDAVDETLTQLDLDETVTPVDAKGGEHQARATLARFVDDRLSKYDGLRGEPGREFTSEISPYLHFGQLSPITALLTVLDTATGADADTFVEQLVVRRELSHNFTWFHPDYDSFESVPEWARKTLSKHSGDPRDPSYTREDLESGDTHDRYWNAAMIEMTETGYLHNYMRMYWGKRILAWTEDPEEAFERTLYLNNRYLLDGRDPNSYAGVGWCFRLHDRPWPEREIFGTVRTMTAGGLRSKKDMAAYISRIEEVTDRTVPGD